MKIKSKLKKKVNISRQALDALIVAGSLCSNVCYNLSQDRSISNDDQRSMKEAYKEAYKRWDIARLKASKA